MRETPLKDKIRRGVGRFIHIRLFPNPVGIAYIGKEVGRTLQRIILENVRKIAYGLAVGSSDFIGLRSIEITQDMVGKRIAQFVALEVKVPGNKPTEVQRNFIAMVRDLGGVGEVVTSLEEAMVALGLEAARK